jgi:hypothetical protein
MTTKPPNFGDAPWPDRDPEVPYDHDRAAKEFLDAADRICSQAKVGAIPFDRSLLLMSTQPSASVRPSWPCFRNSAQDQKKRRKAQDQEKGTNLQSRTSIKILEEVKGEISDRSPVLYERASSLCYIGRFGESRRPCRRCSCASAAISQPAYALHRALPLAHARAGHVPSSR